MIEHSQSGESKKIGERPSRLRPLLRSGRRQVAWLAKFAGVGSYSLETKFVILCLWYFPLAFLFWPGNLDALGIALVSGLGSERMAEAVVAIIVGGALLAPVVASLSIIIAWYDALGLRGSVEAVERYLNGLPEFLRPQWPRPTVYAGFALIAALFLVPVFALIFWYLDGAHSQGEHGWWAWLGFTCDVVVEKLLIFDFSDVFGRFGFPPRFSSLQPSTFAAASVDMGLRLVIDGAIVAGLIAGLRRMLPAPTTRDHITDIYSDSAYGLALSQFCEEVRDSILEQTSGDEADGNDEPGQAYGLDDHLRVLHILDIGGDTKPAKQIFQVPADPETRYQAMAWLIEAGERQTIENEVLEKLGDGEAGRASLIKLLASRPEVTQSTRVTGKLIDLIEDQRTPEDVGLAATDALKHLYTDDLVDRLLSLMSRREIGPAILDGIFEVFAENKSDKSVERIVAQATSRPSQGEQSQTNARGRQAVKVLGVWGGDVARNTLRSVARNTLLSVVQDPQLDGPRKRLAIEGLGAHLRTSGKKELRKITSALLDYEDKSGSYTPARNMVLNVLGKVFSNGGRSTRIQRVVIDRLYARARDEHTPRSVRRRAAEALLRINTLRARRIIRHLKKQDGSRQIVEAVQR